MNDAQRAQILADVAERVALWNEFRTDDFQDRVVRLVNSEREHWRSDRGELPRIGTSNAPAWAPLACAVEPAMAAAIAGPYASPSP